MEIHPVTHLREQEAGLEAAEVAGQARHILEGGAWALLTRHRYYQAAGRAGERLAVAMRVCD